MVAGVGNIERAVGGYRDAGGVSEHGRRAGAAVTGETGLARARHRGDDTGGYFADAVIVGVGHVERARGIHGDAERSAQAGVAGLAAVTVSAGLARAGDRGDDAVRGDAANAVVEGVRDVDVARGVDGKAGRRVQRGLESRHAFAAAAGDAVAGDRSDDAGAGDFRFVLCLRHRLCLRGSDGLRPGESQNEQSQRRVERSSERPQEQRGVCRRVSGLTKHERSANTVFRAINFQRSRLPIIRHARV